MDPSTLITAASAFGLPLVLVLIVTFRIKWTLDLRVHAEPKNGAPPPVVIQQPPVVHS